MFNNRKTSLLKQIEIGDTAGDLAVEGLFSGLLAGFVMEIYLILSGIAMGLNLIEALTRLSPIKGLPPVSGVLLHLAISGIYGTVFGLVVHWLPRRLLRPYWGWWAGLAYGIILLFLAEFLILPNTVTALHEFPLLHLVIAHLLFGLILGIRMNMFRPNPEI